MEYISKDELWKGAIEDCIVPFIHYFYGNWTLRSKIGRQSNLVKAPMQCKASARSSSIIECSDKLVKVFLLNGEEKWFLIHVEVQSQADNTLNNRMFTMYYRLKDKYKVDVAQLAILAYGKAKKIGIYKEDFWDTSLTFKFKTYNIIDEVEKGNIDRSNIFSIIIQSVYTDMKYNENNEEKYHQKIKLIEDFLGRKSSDKEYYQLLNFISIFIRLNYEYEEESKNFIIKKTKTKNMGLKELFEKTIEKVVKKERAALLKKDEALLKKDENTVVNSFKNGISIPLIVNITNLSTKEVKAILKKKGLI